jgi:hypothetical protein
MSAFDIYRALTVAYVTTVIGMVLLTMSRADKAMLHVALVLLINWAANQGYSDATGLVSPWWFRLGVDALSAFALTVRPSGFVQARVAEFFIVMVVVSGSVGIGAILGRINPADQLLAWRYDITLSAVGVAQLIYFVVSGGINGGGKRNPAWPRLGRSSGLVVAQSARRETGQQP